LSAGFKSAPDERQSGVTTIFGGGANVVDGRKPCELFGSHSFRKTGHCGLANERAFQFGESQCHG
jgi:hypothetical protein